MEHETLAHTAAVPAGAVLAAAAEVDRPDEEPPGRPAAEIGQPQRLCGNESMQLGPQSRFRNRSGFGRCGKDRDFHELVCIVAASTI